MHTCKYSVGSSERDPRPGQNERLLTNRNEGLHITVKQTNFSFFEDRWHQWNVNNYYNLQIDLL